MNLKTTLGLVLVAAAGAALWWFDAKLPVSLSLSPPSPPPAASETVRVLTEEITDDKLTRIELKQGDQVLILQKNGAWTLPGKWPTRTAEVKQLVALLAGLESRFAPVAVTDETDLNSYGLGNPGVTVLVQADGKDYRLTFGEGEDGTVSRFARPTWLRLATKDGDEFKPEPEVVRLAPGLVAALDKPADYYQQRRLFPGDRVAKEGEPGEKVDRLNAKSLTLEQKKEGGVKYTLTKTGDGWELSQPVRDRVDPDKLKSILTAVPDVWAESFVRDPKKREPAVTGLDKPEEEIQVTLPNGTVMTLLVGKVSQTKTRTVTRPAPPGSPFPPQKETVHDEYRYARLKDNDQVFEIQGEKLKDLFPTTDTLRDAKLARFSTADALRVEIVRPGQQPIVLTKDKDKNRWSIAEPIKADAETAKITDLLDKLANMQARDKDILDKADPKKYGLDAPALVTVKAEETASGGREPPGGDTKKKVEKTFTFEIGRHDDKEKRLYVRVKGWDRVNAVEENVLPLVNRPVLAYRGRRVLDFAISDVDGIKVQSGDETLSLSKADGKWSLAEPVKAEADADKIDTLAGNLGNLEAVEYISDAVKPDDLEPMYGLGKPAVTATLTFSEKDKPAKTLLIGKQREGKDEYFAKLADADSVFAVKKDIRESLSQRSLAYRPLDLWKFQPDDLAELRVQKGAEPEYTLTRKEGGWKITAPFQANVTEALVTPMSEELAKAKADKYAAHALKDAAEYGLDKPALRLTVVPKKDDANKDAKDRVLLVGKEAKEGGRYAKLSDSDAVVIVPGKLFVAADRGALDLLDRNLLGVDRDAVEKVRAVVGDAKLALQKQKEGGWEVVESPAKPFPADRVAVDALLNVWANLRAEKFVAYAPKADELPKYGLDKPATVTVAIPNKDKEETHTLEIGKAVEGGKDRYARLSGKPEVAVLPASAVDRLTATYLDYVNRNLFDVDTGSVAAVVRGGKDALEVVKRDDGWYLVKPAELRADDRVVLDLLKQLTGRATRVAAYPADDLKAYGLDSPEVVTLRVKGADDKVTEQVLRVGKPVGEGAAATGERFALLGDGKAVLVLPPPLVQGLLAGPLGFRDRSLVKFADADKATLERGERKVSFARTDGTWKITSPLNADAEHTELENLINAVAELRAAEFVAEKPADRKEYGLDKPTVQWRFQSGDKDVLNLALGGAEKNGSRRYAALQGSELVFLLDGGVSNKLLAEYRSRAVWSPSLDSAQAEELRYTKGATVFGFEKVGADWKQTDKPEAKVKADVVTDTLAAIAGLKAERYVQDKDANFKLYGLDPAELVIEVGTGGGKRTLHVGRAEGESKRYYARVLDKDRTDVFVISEVDAARIVRELPAFVQATP